MNLRFSTLKNLSVAAKLFGGFAILIVISIISSLISIQQSDTIREHALKGKLISEISDDLNTARRARLTFQLSHDENALQANKVAIEKMKQKTVIGETFTWNNEARVLFDSLKETIPIYTDARDTFSRLDRLSAEAEKQLTSQSIKENLDKYSQLVAGNEQPTRQEVTLLNALNRVWSDAVSASDIRL